MKNPAQLNLGTAVNCLCVNGTIHGSSKCRSTTCCVRYSRYDIYVRMRGRSAAACLLLENAAPLDDAPSPPTKSSQSFANKMLNFPDFSCFSDCLRVLFLAVFNRNCPKGPKGPNTHIIKLKTAANPRTSLGGPAAPLTVELHWNFAPS